MTLYLVALLVLGLMCGSELDVGAFAHPTLNRQPARNTHSYAHGIRAIIGTRDAFLDGGLDAAESLVAATLRATEPRGLAARGARFRNSSSRDSLLALRTRADQQPHH
jgi:hypothetical protein